MFVNSAALHRLVQTINWQGSIYEFLRQERNEYGELSEEPVPFAQIKGLFHNGSSEHINVYVSDGATVIEKNTPYIFTTWGNAEKLRLDDRVIINGKTFKVTGRTNISELNLVGDISLEVVL